VFMLFRAAFADIIVQWTIDPWGQLMLRTSTELGQHDGETDACTLASCAQASPVSCVQAVDQDEA
jgi:hypothetical protein